MVKIIDFDDSFKLSKEERDTLLQFANESDSTKIIKYLKKIELKNKINNRIIFICTILAAIFSGISAISVIIELFLH